MIDFPLISPLFSIDIMFLFSDTPEQIDLKKYVNSIYAAISLEIDCPEPTDIMVKIIGNNGQLPNLDLRNVIERVLYIYDSHSILMKEEDRTFLNFLDIYSQEPSTKIERNGGMWKSRLVRPQSYVASSFEEILWDFESIFDMTRKLAIGKADGYHGVFLSQKIEALTIQGVCIAENRKIELHNSAITSIAVAIDGASRSINNLLELFHQSFFYYLLPRNDRYVSNGDYFIPLVMTILIPLSLGVKYFFMDSYLNRKEEENYNSNSGKNLTQFLKYLLISFGLVGLCHSEAFYFEDVVVFGLFKVPKLLIANLFLCAMNQVKKSQNETELSSESEKNHIKSIYLIFLATIMLCYSMINFSIVFLTNLVLLPILLVIFDLSDNKKSIAKYLQQILIFLSISVYSVDAPPFFNNVFAQFIEDGRSYNKMLGGDYLTYNYLVFCILPFLVLLQFIV